MNVPEIFVCARRAPSATAVVSVYFAEFVEASRQRAKNDAADLLKQAYARAQRRQYAEEARPVTGFGKLEA